MLIIRSTHTFQIPTHLIHHYTTQDHSTHLSVIHHLKPLQDLEVTKQPGQEAVTCVGVHLFSGYGVHPPQGVRDEHLHIQNQLWCAEMGGGQMGRVRVGRVREGHLKQTQKGL